MTYRDPCQFRLPGGGLSPPSTPTAWGGPTIYVLFLGHGATGAGTFRGATRGCVMPTGNIGRIDYSETSVQLLTRADKLPVRYPFRFALAVRYLPLALSHYPQDIEVLDKLARAPHLRAHAVFRALQRFVPPRRSR